MLEKPDIPGDGGPLKLMLSADELAAALGISRAMVWKLHSSGRLPSPVRFGRVVRWHRETLNRWLAEGAPPRERFEASRSSSPK